MRTSRLSPSEDSLRKPERSTEWQPLRPLADSDLAYNFQLVEAWHERWQQLRQNPDAPNRIAKGLELLQRSEAIETGVIEGLYALTRDVTINLLQHGFRSDMIDPASTNLEPERLVEILQDHQSASKLVHGYIRDQRPMSLHTVRELHDCITAHQLTHTVVDSLGPRRTGVAARAVQDLSQPPDTA